MISILNIAHPAIVTIVECAYCDINAEQCNNVKMFNYKTAEYTYETNS